ncbi:methionine synthase [Methanomicrobium antiquum]|uniref:Methionine synthase n=1 Tax=Methanomicrobium antiquum TaxID=487686 RepID=A0AAF0JLX6_9EURY|nr:methionine synthase [Methanomicrobium antiquum]MDD3976852.1 methionine synthase [Methanomicrobium sp.]WFN35876.1 methionine synthase [Methanomicrobium antiquum]
MKLIKKLLPTTVVGSYPSIRAKGLKSIIDPYSQALNIAVEDQIAAGIDIISSGQVREDMITSLTSRIPGIKDKKVTGILRPTQKPMTVEDTRYAISKHAKVKAMLAGPSTISHALKIDTPLYRNRDELILDLAQIVAAEATRLESLGIAIFQIDEPILSTGVADMNTAYQAISAITGVLRVPTCMHVCGNIENIIDNLLKMPVDILDLEFSNNQNNLDVISKKDLREKQVGLGVVDSADTEIDSVETIISRIEKGVELFGPEKILVDPDCGLRMHTRETAYGKLRNMVLAAESVRSNL